MHAILGKAKWLSKLCRSFAWAQVQRRVDLNVALKDQEMIQATCKQLNRHYGGSTVRL